MKIVTLVIVSALMSLSTTAQFKIDYDTIKTIRTAKDIEFEVWMSIHNKPGKFFTFKQNPVGVMKAMKMINFILKHNELTYEKYEDDNSLISSLVKDMTDYETIDLTIKNGSSIINRLWSKGDEVIVLSLEDKEYMIFVANKQDG